MKKQKDCSDGVIRNCAKCGRELSIKEFYSNGMYIDCYCRECRKIANREYRLRRVEKEKRKLYEQH